MLRMSWSTFAYLGLTIRQFVVPRGKASCSLMKRLERLKQKCKMYVPAGQGVIWMGHVLRSFAQMIESAITVLGDNEATLSLLAEKRHTKM